MNLFSDSAIGSAEQTLRQKVEISGFLLFVACSEKIDHSDSFQKMRYGY